MAESAACNQKSHLGLAILLTAGLVAAYHVSACAIFGRTDVATIWILSAIPAAVWMASSAKRIAAAPSLKSAAIVILLAWLGIVFTPQVWSVVHREAESTALIAVLRVILAILPVTAIGLLCLTVDSSHRNGVLVHRKGVAGRAWGIAALIAATVIPLTYADHTADRLEKLLSESMSSSRPRRSQHLAMRLRELRPQAEYQGVPLSDVVNSLDRVVSELEGKAALPLPPQATENEIGKRAMVLMQLERLDDALSLLEPLTRKIFPNPIALDYCGLCCQRLGRWQESLKWYEAAREHWMKQPPQTQHTAALLSALKGVAFAQRRLENHLAAEEAYTQALAIAPTAEVHFLLARAYEEAQRAEPARQHARQAMLLDPERYAESAQQLLNQISINDFGCFQADRSLGATD